jgi:hypothetical protein
MINAAKRRTGTAKKLIKKTGNAISSKRSTQGIAKST